MRLERVNVKRGLLAEAGQGLHHTEGLNRKGPRIVVFSRVVHQQRSGDIVYVKERRHLRVGCLGIPEHAFLVLKGHWSQCPVVGLSITHKLLARSGETVGKANSPPWQRRGECAQFKKSCEATFVGRRRGGSL